MRLSVFSIFIGGKVPVKTFVTTGHIVSQILFTSLYIVPLLNFSATVKTIALIITLLAAQIIHNLVNAPKTNWYMSMIKDGTRGKFTAIKEIVSLIGSAVFSFGLSYVMDGFENANNMRAAFICGAMVLGALTVMHTLTLIFSKKTVVDADLKTCNDKKRIKHLFKNKTLLKLLLVSSLWITANYATLSFSGTYMNEELGFSLTFSSVIILGGSLFRSLFCVPFGKLADKKGFCTMLITCLSIAAAGYAVNIFTVPENGKILYPVYYALYCIAMAGTDSSMINLFYDYVAPDERADALALSQSISGIAGFVITLILSAVMGVIKKNGNTLFGITVYSQQLSSLISFAIIMICVVYLEKVIKKLPRANTLSDIKTEKDTTDSDL